MQLWPEAPQSFSQYNEAPVLVTGGCGFIGSHLVERLVECGATVTVLDNLQAGQWANLRTVEARIRQIEADVRDTAAVTQAVREIAPHYVFHLAANASVPGSVQDPAYDFETNSGGTFTLLEALRQTNKCKKIVTVSSGAVYGEPESFPIRETNLLRPISPYGASKYCSEVESRMFYTVYKQPVVIARLFNAYGPRMARFVVLDFLRKLQNTPERLEVLGNGKQVRDFTYVSDTVQGLLLLGTQGENGESYNISSGINYSVTELAHHLIAVLGLMGRTEIAYTGKSWVGDAQRWEVSIDKIATLGYRSCVSLDEGLANTRDWFAARQAE